MKKVGKILGRIAIGLFVVLYVGIAALNYSVVQSYIGSAAGAYFSREWGGELRIGSLHAMPWDHLILNDILMVSPSGDTILRGDCIRASFKRFPFKNGELGGCLNLSHVYLRNVYYHFESIKNPPGSEHGHSTNLQYIIDYYASDEEHEPSGKVFTVNVERVTLRNVHYKMDLPDNQKIDYANGVDIPHMEFLDINGRMRNVHVANADVTVKLLSFSTTERSGFRVENISGDVHVGPQDITVRNLDVETPRSHIMADVEMLYPDWMKDYIHDVEHDVVLHDGTTVSFTDVAYWAPVLWGIEAQVATDGHAYGRIDSLVADGMQFYYGLSTTAYVSGAVVGLPDIETTVFDIEDVRMRTEDIDGSRLEADLGGRLPHIATKYLEEVAYLDLSVNGNGGYKHASTASVNIASGIGNLRADAQLTPTAHGLQARLEANSDGLGLSLLHSDWLTHTGLALSAEAEIPNNLRDIKALAAEATLELTGSTIRGQRLAPIGVHANMADGTVAFEASSTDTLLYTTIDGYANIADSVHSYFADIKLDHFDGQAFGLLPEKFNTLSTHLTVEASGNTLDEISGIALAKNTRLGQMQIKELDLNVESTDGYKTLRLESDPVNATVYGQFAYADLTPMVQHMLSSVVPNEIAHIEGPDEATMERIANNTVNISAQWNDDGRFLHALSPKTHVAKGTRMSGSFNCNEMLKVVMRSDSVRMGGVVVEGLGLSTRSAGNNYIVELETQGVNISNLTMFNNMDLILNSNHRRTIAELSWGDNDSINSGDLMLRLQENQISVMRPYFFIDRNRWELTVDSMYLFRDDALNLTGHGIRLQDSQQSIAATVNLQHTDADFVKLTFNDFRVGDISKLALQGSNIELGGSIDGYFDMYGIGKIPYFNANLNVDSCSVNQHALGLVKVTSNWNAELNTLNMQLNNDQLMAHGWLGLGKDDPDLNFAIDFDSFDLSFVAPMMTDFSSRFEGLLHGSIDIGGSVKHPIVIGDALVENGAIAIDLTGVTYYFNDSIRFASNTIHLDRFKLIDPKGNIAYVDGTIKHDGLQNATLDLDVQTDNLLLLDKTDGEQFYGTLLASATGNVGGRLDDIKIEVAARTTPGCNLYVPVNDQRQVKSHRYISFVGDSYESRTTTTTTTEQKESKLNLELTLTITPDVKLNLPMSFSSIGVDVAASGNGDMYLTLDGNQTPQILGNYEITRGTMKTSLASVITKDFTIESGSNLNFQGSLPDARFDIKAVYSQRANLSTLTGSLSTVDNTQKYIQVENVIAVSGTLQEPTLKFDMRLPNADQSIEDEVFAYIDRNSERDMLNQTISLLINGQFYNVSGNDPAMATTSGGIGTIASTLGGMMADMVGIVDINIDYKAATEMTNQQLDLNISKDWGRWYLESTLGYGGESRELEASSTGGTVIDALIGYRISPLVHLFAYNRTNTNDYTRMDLPYKQGIGLKLTKDFDHWGQLLGIGKYKRKSQAKGKQ